MDQPRVVRNVRTFGDLIDLHDEDMREVGRPPRRSKAAVMASLKTELGSVKLPALNRERLIEFGRKRAKQGAGPATLAIDMSFIRTIVTHAAAVHGIEVSGAANPGLCRSATIAALTGLGSAQRCTPESCQATIFSASPSSASTGMPSKSARAVKAGQAVLIPPGLAHNDYNVSDKPYKALANYIVEKGKPLASPVPPP
jgi:hypothetical protein